MGIGIDIISLLLLSIGLAMDAFSVATVTGFGLNKLRISDATKMSFSFGAGHVVMPILGWIVGSTVVSLISNYDHWAAFLLLAFVGVKMIIDGLRGEEEKIDSTSIINTWNLLLFTLAVSVDSLAVGLSFSLEKVSILIPSLFMGAGTLTFTFIGLIIGNRTGQAFGKGAQVFGGLVLLLIGLRIVYDHNGFAALMTVV